jgi:hypothetical protein
LVWKDVRGEGWGWRLDYAWQAIDYEGDVTECSVDERAGTGPHDVFYKVMPGKKLFGSKDRQTQLAKEV